MSALTRYDADRSAPTVREAARDALVRAALPAVLLFGVVLGLGLVLAGPLHGVPSERALSQALADGRTPLMNTLTRYGSLTGSTGVIAVCTLLAVLLLWWATRQWWSAVVPAIAVLLELAVFLSTSLIVGRPRPDVPHLDQAPPTSSYPSGHTGASTALWFSLALLAQRIRSTWVRVLVTVLCALVPFAVAYSRMYRGMHSATDVAAGFLNGAVCAALAYGYLRRDTGRAAPVDDGPDRTGHGRFTPELTPPVGSPTPSSPTSAFTPASGPAPLRTGRHAAAPTSAPPASAAPVAASDAGVPRAGEGVDAVRRQAHRHEDQQHPSQG
ncbi:MAG: hypothetical protein BGO38_12280 [Cellulomonas sp. 73-145]|uniref:phosphatase PAP2 family protein n=1 Tax=Cellulomonas sp. 73-145 TaxID=1895739 RepID=UPI00092BC894|nr:phosphatase PAP2 family protein [Cellulomonas sp. 73-145]OJV59588.1 MAG: hypothetical protein BGO38_12280 [Cellulomonas sp. 73-145]